MMALVSAAQMRALDDETIKVVGVPGAVLMESAGRGVVERVLELGRDGQVALREGQVVVVCGPGNNGGDGMVVGRYLHGRGVQVRLLVCAVRDRLRGDALLQLRAAEAAGVPLSWCAGEDGAGQVAAVLAGLGRRDLIVDALLGTGLTRAVTGPLRAVIEAMNAGRAVLLAVDLPSGLDADRGEPESDGGEAAAIVRASHTVTFGFPKLGLCGAPGFSYAGKITVVDIGIPPELAARHGVTARLLDATCLERLGAPGDPLGHKGSHGHLLVIAGSRGKTGAALLCASAAQTVGVGLCTVASPREAQAALQGRVSEAMTAAYPAPDEAGAAEIAAALGQLAQDKRALAIGPGLPTEAPMRQALLELLRAGTAPAVLDADALNLLAQRDSTAVSPGGGAADLLPIAGRRPLVLTPHPGEAGRLLGQATAAVQADRVAAAVALAERTGAVVVLKGARTVIAEPGPARRLSVNPTGNAGMGSGGMGDTLTGMVGALLCAGFSAYDAACAAAYWHGLAGDLLLEGRPPSTILLASEVCAALPSALLRALATCAGDPAPTGGPDLRPLCLGL